MNKRGYSELFLFEVIGASRCLYDLVLIFIGKGNFLLSLRNCYHSKHYEIFPEDVQKFNEYIQDPLFEIEVEKFLTTRNLKRI